MYEIVVTREGYLPSTVTCPVDGAVDDVAVTLQTVMFSIAGVARSTAAAGGVLPGGALQVESS